MNGKSTANIITECLSEINTTWIPHLSEKIIKCLECK